MTPPVDPLPALLELPGVGQAVTDARTAVDQLLWDRTVRARQDDVVAESLLRGAWVSAWFEGAETELEPLRSGAALDGSPVGRLLANTLALHSALPELVPVIGRSPGQALARMHALAAHGFAPDEQLGRPRAADTPDDTLRLGPAPQAAEAAERLAAVSQLLVSSEAPGVLVAAVAHAELAVVRPFGWGSGLVARAVIRLVLAQRGVDPGMQGAPEVGIRRAGRPAYVRALRDYARGTPEGVAAGLTLIAEAIAFGAGQPRLWVEQESG